jgi:phosphopantothenoylcysteine decarboxylase/phosphopantothenate--cysteine ligase
VITNRSSGKQGFALAQAALDLGAETILISGPSALATPTGAQRIDIQTAQEMLDAVLENSRDADVLIMAAAVADFRPVNTAEQKIKKRDGLPQIKLEPTPDILSAIPTLKDETGHPQVTVGFAAESQDLEENARAKLVSKRLDLIVANEISAPDAGFGVDTNRVTLLYANGKAEVLPLLTKVEVAQAVLDRVAGLLEAEVAV